MCGVICPYKNKCTSHPHKCGRCANNSGRKDYFVPDWPRRRKRRCYPWYPWWEWIYYPDTWYTHSTTITYSNDDIRPIETSGEMLPSVWQLKSSTSAEKKDYFMQA